MNTTHVIHPIAGSAPVMNVSPELGNFDLPIPMPKPADLEMPANYGRRRCDLMTRGAVMHALRVTVERVELVAATVPQQERQATALALLAMVMNDAEPGLGDRLRKALG